MKIKTLSLSLLCSLAILLTNCLAEKEIFKLGLALPLSGPIARMGQAVKRGVELFQELEPDKASKFKYIYEDSKYDGKETVTALTKFSKIDQASLAVVWGNTPSGAASSVAQGLGLDTVLISHDPHSNKYSQVIELGPAATACIGVFAERARQAGLDKIGTIGIDIGNVISFLDTLDQAVDKKLFREIVSSDAAQFQPQLLRGKAKGITTYLTALMPEQALNLFRQARQLNLKFSVIGIDAFADPEFLRTAETLMPDLTFVYGPAEDWFIRAYAKKFKDTSFLTEASSGYVFAQLASRLLEVQDANKKTFHERVKSVSLPGLAYKNAQLSKTDVRISAPCSLISLKDYLELGN